MVQYKGTKTTPFVEMLPNGNSCKKLKKWQKIVCTNLKRNTFATDFNTSAPTNEPYIQSTIIHKDL